MPFQIIRNDITKVKADAVVNTANPDAAVGDGVDHAIYEAAGREKLLKARREIGRLEAGEAGITPAFDLPAKYIIHSSGPRWLDGKHGEGELLRQCYDRSLELADEYGCRSVAFPLMATGSYGFPQELGIQIAVDAFISFLAGHEMDITLVVFGSTAYKISGQLFESVDSFIDDHYAGSALEAEYQNDGIPTFGNARISRSGEQRAAEPMSAASPQAAPRKAAPGKAAPRKESLDKVLKGIYTDSFEKHLQQIINKKGLKNAEVYAAANISKQYFSKLLKGQVKPSKEKVLALAVGLKLNTDEALDFLRLAGYALSPISQTDAVVEYFLENKDYNVMKIDIVLFDYGLEPLSKG